MHAAALRARERFVDHGEHRRDADARRAEDDVAGMLKLEHEEAHRAGEADGPPTVKAANHAAAAPPSMRRTTSVTLALPEEEAIE